MKILITGSSGMIGTALTQKLREQYTVDGLDVVEPTVHPNYFYNVDLRHPRTELPTNYDVIVHLAANSRVRESIEEPQLAVDNVIMTQTVLELARKQTTSPLVILASSREVYGNSRFASEDEGSQRSVENPYAASKVATEAFAWSYQKCYGLDTVIVRLSNVYGNYDYSSRFIPKAISLLKEGLPLEIHGRSKKLDFIYISDVVDCLSKIIEDRCIEEFNEFNIAFGESVSLLSVAEKLKEKLHSESRIIVTDTIDGEVSRFAADISRISLIGYIPKVGIDEGLDLSINNYK